MSTSAVHADPLQHDIGRLPVADPVARRKLRAELDVVVARVHDGEAPLALDHGVAVGRNDRAVVPAAVGQDAARELDNLRVLDNPDRIVGH